MKKFIMNKTSGIRAIHIIGICLFILFINGIYFRMNVPINADEFTSLWTVLLLGGKKGTSVLELVHYHGYGHLLILAPFAKLFANGELFYKVCMGLMVLYKVFLALLSYRIMTKYFEIKEIYAFFFILVLSISKLSPDSVFPNSVMTELPISFLCVIICYLMVKYCKKRKWYYIFGMAFLSIWCTTVHSRALIIQISLLLSIMYIFVCSQRFDKIRLIIVFLISFVILFILIRKFDNYVINLMYSSETERIHNDVSYSDLATNGIFSKAIFDLLNLENLGIAVKVFFSLSASMVFWSFGTIGIAIAVLCVFLIKEIRKPVPQRNLALDVCTIYCLSSIFLMNISIAIISTKNIKEGNFRWYNYVRYALPFVWMIMILALTVVLKKYIVVRKLVGLALVVEFFLSKWYLGYIAEELDFSGYKMSMNAFNTFGPNTYSAKEYYSWILVAMCLFYIFLFVISFCKKYYLFFFCISFLLLSCVFFYQSWKTYIKRDAELEGKIDKSVDYLETMYDDSKIYVSGSTNYTLWLHYVALDKEINYVDFDSISDVNEDTVIFTDKYPEYINISQTVIELDDGEYCILGANTPQ